MNQLIIISPENANSFDSSIMFPAPSYGQEKLCVFLAVNLQPGFIVQLWSYSSKTELTLKSGGKPAGNEEEE